MMDLTPQVVEQQSFWHRFLMLPPVIQSAVVGSFLAALSGGMVVLALLSNPAPIQPAPFAYEPARVRADPFSVCPGDTLAYKISGRLDSDVPRMAFVYGGIKNEAGRRAWRMPLGEVRVITTDALHGPFGPLDYSPESPVPELPPGRYVWEHTAAVDAAGAASVYVDFEIAEGCP